MEHKLAISPYVYIMLPAALLVLPIPWALGWCIAVFVHELGHYIALRLCRVPICLIEITPFGIRMHTGQMSGGETLLCALAGPLFGLLLLGLSSYMPYTALCAFLQSLFNLLPIYPMDGGRALRAILGIFRAGEGVFNAVERILLFFTVWVLTLVIWRLQLGILPCACIGGIFSQKFLANHRKNGYNRGDNDF